jgi:hypothetical protein
MLDAELLQWHAKAVSDTNALLAFTGDVWQRINELLRDEHRASNPVELRNELVRLQSLASDATRRVMSPPKIAKATGG